MLDFYSSALPIARKEHTCEYCSKAINVGEQYSVESGKCDGDFFSRKLCLCCKNILDEFCLEVDQEFDWDEVSDHLRDKWCSTCSKHEDDSCEMMPYECPVIRQHYVKGVL